MREHVPHVLTLARIPLVVVGWLAALRGDALGAGMIMLTAVVTDLADGYLARRWKVATPLGAQLDSAVDMLSYLSLAAWCVILLPEVRGAWWVVGPYSLAYVLVLAFNHRRRGLMGTHDALARMTATLGVASGIWFLWFGFTWWLMAAVMASGAIDLAHRVRLAVRTSELKERGVP